MAASLVSSTSVQLPGAQQSGSHSFENGWNGQAIWKQPAKLLGLPRSSSGSSAGSVDWLATVLVVLATLLVLEQSVYRYKKKHLPGAKWTIPVIGKFAGVWYSLKYSYSCAMELTVFEQTRSNRQCKSTSLPGRNRSAWLPSSTCECAQCICVRMVCFDCKKATRPTTRLCHCVRLRLSHHCTRLCTSDLMSRNPADSSTRMSTVSSSWQQTTRLLARF